MSVTVTLTFATLAEAIAALSGGNTPAAAVVSAVSAPPAAPETAKVKPGKSAQAPAPPATSPPSADPKPDATPATPQTASPAVLDYAPIGERIALAVAATNSRSQPNRTALKALFATLTHKDGADKPVKTGQDVKPEDRPQVVAVLDKLDAEAKADEGAMA
jgi:hypothetical protein